MNNTENSLVKLKDHLKEMFKFQDNDLDFGIYKILKLKQKEIEKFIDGEDEKSLSKIVDSAIKDVSNYEIKKDYEKLETFLIQYNQKQLIEDLKNNYSKIQRVIAIEENDTIKKELNEKLDVLYNHKDISFEIKDKIYNYILSFFELYYNNGDFGYNDRSISPFKVQYDEDYNGNDILFHWKHKGNLYIKTGNGFNSIKFKTKFKEKEYNFEYKVETNDNIEEEIAVTEDLGRNNNKDSGQKHYKFNRIQEGKIIFNLAKKSTPKVKIFKDILTNVFGIDKNLECYLYDDKKKSIYNDLIEKYDEVNNGGYKGLTALKLGKDKIKEKIEKNFKGKETELNLEIIDILHVLDKNLNNFYIGNDSDYFIHNDLRGFLNKERDKFIKNVIFADMTELLNFNINNNVVIIAKAFNEITTKIIEFLSAVEDFQKQLFTINKKIIKSEYCMTVDKIDEKFYQEILNNKQQVDEWKELFNIETKSVEDIKNNPTLVVDTGLFKNNDGSNDFKDRIIETFKNIDEEVNGLLINSENYQALNLLMEKYRGKVKCIYIDPPYNTGSDGFLYKDNFMHSSWLTMMENRLKLAYELLATDGCLFCQIDYKELSKLKELLNNIFKDDNFVQIISVKASSPAGFKTVNPGPIDVTEYILFYTKDRNKFNFKKNYKKVGYDTNYNLYIENKEQSANKWVLKSIIDKFYEINNIKNNQDAKLKWGENWKVIRDIGISDFALKNCEYVVSKRDPHKPTDKVKDLLKKSKKEDSVIEIERSDIDSMYVYKGGVLSFYSNKVKLIDNELTSTEILTDFWDDISWAGIANEGFVKLKNGKKPEKLIKRILEIGSEEGDLVVDFFMGSATTCGVAQKFNRRYIGVEMGEYFDTISLIRVKNALSGEQTGISKSVNWNGGGIFKYQYNEQYEDLLNNISIDNNELDNNSLKYLYKPQEQELSNSLDLSKPFDNKIMFGRKNETEYIDLIETYNYLKGYSIESIKNYKINEKKYKVVKSNNILVIWRDIELGENDTENIISIIKNYKDIDRIDVNYDIDKTGFTTDGYLNVDGSTIEVEIIKPFVFRS